MEAYDDIPVEASGEDCPPPIDAFADVQLHPALVRNIEIAKFSKPTPVQKHAIPVGIARRDLWHLRSARAHTDRPPFPSRSIAECTPTRQPGTRVVIRFH